ncbi:MAG: YbjN domain-containing protein [Cyclobacteriaceae bacterium]
MKKILTICMLLFMGNIALAQADKIIDHSTLTTQGLKEIFENAYLQVLSTNDDFILVKDTYSLYVTLYDANKRYIEFVIFNNFKDGVSQMNKYEFANRINKELIEVTAYCDNEKNQAVFKYDLWIEGNVTAGDIVKAFKAFQNTLTASVLKDTNHILK